MSNYPSGWSYSGDPDDAPAPSDRDARTYCALCEDAIAPAAGVSTRWGPMHVWCANAEVDPTDDGAA